MEDTRKKIVFDGLKATRPMIRLIECQVEKWIKRSAMKELREGKDYDYAVEMEREDDQPSTVHCALKIRIGSDEWKSRESGRTFQDALFRGLKRLSSGVAISQNAKARMSLVQKMLIIPT